MFEASPINYYQMVFMDIRMPVMNGLEAAKKIRTLNRADANEVVIVAMTANAFDEDVRASLDAGMNAHLSKPIEPEKLYECIEEYIH
ncbi:MAG: response regulator [Anaerostipes sp.]|nr:response regulator [Anaerostipes sp.]